MVSFFPVGFFFFWLSLLVLTVLSYVIILLQIFSLANIITIPVCLLYGMLSASGKPITYYNLLLLIEGWEIWFLLLV